MRHAKIIFHREAVRFTDQRVQTGNSLGLSCARVRYMSLATQVSTQLEYRIELSTISTSPAGIDLESQDR